MKTISAIIPTYNRAHCIINAINSVLNQTCPAKEIIIVDDCSTDNTEELIMNLNNPLIKYFRLPEKKGAGGARNFGVSKAEGEYIAFLDSDDCWTSDKLEKQMTYFENNPCFGLVYSRYVIQEENGKKLYVPSKNKEIQLTGDILVPLLFRNTIGAPTVMIRKDVFEEVNGFDEKMNSLEDWDFAIKIAKKYKIGFLPEALLIVHQTVGGVSDNTANYFSNRCLLLKKYKEEYIRTNQLDLALMDIFSLAEKGGVLEQVKQLVMLNLI